MRKQRKLIALMLVLAVMAWSLAACVPGTARRPNVDNANQYRNYNPGMNTPYTAQNNQGTQTNQTAQNNMNNQNRANTNDTTNNMRDGYQTSSLFSQLDYSFATITANKANIRSGPSTGSPVVGTLRTGERVKVIGKLNGWYIVNIPNTNKIGTISPSNAKLYSARPASTEPMPTKPIPTTVTPQTGTGTTPNTNAGGNTGTTGTTGTTGAGRTPTGAGTNTGTTNGAPTATGTGALTADASRILELANAERAKVGAPALKANTDLNKLATMKSQDMVEKNYFSHQSPTYGSPFDMMKTYGISYMYAGENLAINQNAEGAHQAWMNSEGHRRNILNPDFTEIGIGIYQKGNGSYAYTQMFIGR